MKTILVVDDDLTFLKILERYLIKKGYEVVCKSNVVDAISLIREKSFDLLLLDYKLSDGTGLDIISETKSHKQAPSFIIMTRFDDVRLAVKSMKDGAFDYITKPINQEELLAVIEHVFEKQNAGAKTSKNKEEEVRNANASKITLNEGQDFLIGKNQLSKNVTEQIGLVAPTEMSVIIEGESGTGKEHIAQRIHQLSSRKDAPFVAIDCGTLSKELAGSELFGHLKGAFTGALSDKKGKFEAAHSGTIFLDEIGNLSYEVQVKLLRVLQERVVQAIGSNQVTPIDVRVIAATNEDLRLNSSNKTFREDLYFRLNEFKIEVPALRDRGEDLLLFTDYFIEKSNVELNKHVKSFSDEIISVFKAYDWPGNVRELKNVVKRIVLLSKSEVPGLECLPAELTQMNLQNQQSQEGTNLKMIQENKEKQLIIETLIKTKYNKSQAANLLNIDRSTLYAKIKKYGIS
ncbi:sigma-54-dependent transcriptional regulator [Brumimicrobium aurantiacum]|uniref:Sigma-54-dependent Fis family transcriptional regulator n=1 Tax=Brumimicrobium aurantiacum TaxID=1737063 RepID=A0A3E1EVX6_9FLAO|nr:sigma-54 dependent transcriptional regulator [Brumimicrobium aurantiacum]RFC53709.1 sigma-54-dependent Fis family transcriptional regulator [Brumimicrobium aurantiacum]